MHPVRYGLQTTLEKALTAMSDENFSNILFLSFNFFLCKVGNAVLNSFVIHFFPD